MVKTFVLVISLSIAFSKQTCKHAKPALMKGCYKGKLEIKGGCMNYTIAVKEGNIDTTLIVPTWTDENTGKSYKNVFALCSRCNFPTTINEGDEFYFMIDSSAVQNCAVCMMYYPTPQKHVSIKVLEKPCTE